MGNLAVEAYRKARAESKRSPIMLEVIGFFEHREVAEVLDKGKKVKYTVPVSGTHRSAIDVKLSSGLIIRLTVDSWVVDEIYHC
jgi:hypothetical protein